MHFDAETRRRGGKRGENLWREKGEASSGGEKVNGKENAEEAEEKGGARLLPGGELFFERGDEFLKRFAVRGLPLDEDEEAAAVEEDRAGNRPPALHHVQSHGGRGQLVDTRVEFAGTLVRRRADAFDGGGRHGIGRQRRREFAEYGWEDVELGMRFRELGTRAVFNKRAVAFHFKPPPQSVDVLP